jgi:hypothetical protein
MSEITCPECQGALVIDDHAEAQVAVFCPNPGGMPYIEMRKRPAIVAFCCQCEWAHEIEPKFVTRIQ